MVPWIQIILIITIILIILNNISFVKIIILKPKNQNLDLKLNTSHFETYIS
jgi:hypothetical protein